ncbi:MAG: 3-deoxy-manno-octulosonate cytidylyltransferase [Planctomycetota bacterium]
MPPHIVIPARLASSRLPEKLLRIVAGRTILQHTYQAVLRAVEDPQRITIAVDDQRLADACDSFGANWKMTGVDCPSGTDRIAQVADVMHTENPDTCPDAFVNVQGDEPEIAAQAIQLVCDLLQRHTDADMITVATPIRECQRLDDPSVVKIAIAANGDANDTSENDCIGRAIYFSRSPIPHVRDTTREDALQHHPPIYWHHLGLYGYRREFLQWFATAPPSPLEQRERLEQLRAIESGKQILLGRIDQSAPGIDTPADLQAFEQRIKSESKSITAGNHHAG